MLRILGKYTAKGQQKSSKGNSKRQSAKLLRETIYALCTKAKASMQLLLDFQKTENSSSNRLGQSKIYTQTRLAESRRWQISKLSNLAEGQMPCASNCLKHSPIKQLSLSALTRLR